MRRNDVYSIPLGDPELNITENLKWLFDSDESEEWGKKKKKKKKRKAKKKSKKKAKKKKQMKKIKRMEKALEYLLMEQKKARKKSRKKSKKMAKKQLQREFSYRLIEKSADVTMHMISDATRMYMQSKFSPSGNNK